MLKSIERPLVRTLCHRVRCKGNIPTASCSWKHRSYVYFLEGLELQTPSLCSLPHSSSACSPKNRIWKCWRQNSATPSSYYCFLKCEDSSQKRNRSTARPLLELMADPEPTEQFFLCPRSQPCNKVEQTVLVRHVFDVQHTSRKCLNIVPDRACLFQLPQPAGQILCSQGPEKALRPTLS